jgi:hypothetical protein
VALGTYFDTPRIHGWCHGLGTGSGLAQLVVCFCWYSRLENHGRVMGATLVSLRGDKSIPLRVGSGRVALLGVVGHGLDASGTSDHGD